MQCHEKGAIKKFPSIIQSLPEAFQDTKIPYEMPLKHSSPSPRTHHFLKQSLLGCKTVFLVVYIYIYTHTQVKKNKQQVIMAHVRHASDVAYF